MPDVNVPIIGKMPRGAMLAGGLAVVAVGGYLIYKHMTTKTTTPTAASAAGYGYGYGTGGYGSYGYGAQGTYGFGGGGQYPWYGYGGQQGQQGQPPITTNAQWGQAAEAAMGSTGSDNIAAAIAKYLSGSFVTQDQELIVQEAMAVVGPVPVPSITGYPPKIHVSKTGPGGGAAVNPVAGLHQTQEGVTGANISWSPSAGASSYQVTATKGKVSVSGTSARIHDINTGRDRGDQSTVSVLAQPAAPGAQPATLVVHTRR